MNYLLFFPVVFTFLFAFAMFVLSDHKSNYGELFRCFYNSPAFDDVCFYLILLASVIAVHRIIGAVIEHFLGPQQLDNFLCSNNSQNNDNGQTEEHEDDDHEEGSSNKEKTE